MKKVLLALVAIAWGATVCIADETHGDAETKADITRHRAIGKFCGMKHEH